MTVLQIGVAFYEMLQAVDQQCQHLSYMDPICDFLYHIKYMYTGDSVKEQVSLVIKWSRTSVKSETETRPRKKASETRSRPLKSGL